MNSTNKIEKYTYQSDDTAPVSLLEYVNILEDDKRYLIFKFHNNLNQRLYMVQYQIDSYDIDYNLIERSTFTYDSINIIQNGDFITEKKLRVSKDMVHIKVSLIQAKFSMSQYKDGTLTKLDISEIKEDSKVGNVNYRKIKKEEKVDKKTYKKIEKTKKNKYKVVSVSNKRTPKYTRFVTTLLTVVTLIFLFISVFTYVEMYGSRFTYGVLNYVEKNDGVYVCGVNEPSNEINIPQTVTVRKNLKEYKYDVIGIETGAFKNTTVKGITLNSNVEINEYAFANSDISYINNPSYITYIGDYAFSNCTNLYDLEVQNSQYVGIRAFEGCTNFKKLIAPNATVYPNAFYGIDYMDYLNIGNTSSTSFSTIFDSTLTEDMTDTFIIDTLLINRAKITKTYFLHTYFEWIYLTNSSVTVQYGSLYPYASTSGNVTYDSNHEYIDGKIVSTKVV